MTRVECDGNTFGVHGGGNQSETDKNDARSYTGYQYGGMSHETRTEHKINNGNTFGVQGGGNQSETEKIKTVKK